MNHTKKKIANTMNFKFLRTAALPLFIGISVPILAGVLHGETVIEDNFSLTDRGAGLPLNGTATEKGDLTWQASKNVMLNGAENAGYVSVASPTAFSARVPLPDGAKEISVEASLHVAPGDIAGAANNFLALGIGNPELDSPPWGQGVFLCIHLQGTFICAFNPDRNDIRSKENVNIVGAMGRIPEFHADGLTKVKLVYNKEDHTVSAWINELPVFESVPVPSEPSQVNPAFAGFSGYNQQPNVKTAANFRVTVSP